MGSLLCFLLDIVARAGVITQVDHSGKPVQAVSNGDVQRLPKNAVTLLRVRDDLCIASRHVKDNGILRACDLSSHFDICAFRKYREGKEGISYVNIQ